MRWLEILQSVSWTISDQEIKALDGLSSSSFAKIIFGALNDHASGARIVMSTNIDVVCSGHVFCVW